MNKVHANERLFLSDRLYRMTLSAIRPKTNINYKKALHFKND